MEASNSRDFAMKLPRRKFLHLATAAATLPSLTGIANALGYPTRPAHIVVGFPPGGAPDIIARLIGQWLSERLGQQFFVDNRPGAAGNIGTEIVAKAPPDGYTLLLAVSTTAVNAALYTNLNFNFIRDVAPVASIGGTPFVMAFNPSFPAKTIPEFIAYAKANPGKVNMGSQGIGTTPHVCGELFKMMTGVDFVHVPYRVNLMPDLLAGQAHFYFGPMPQAIEYIKGGRLRALGVTTATRAEALSDVPAIGEFVPGYAAVGWFGICVPSGTPIAIVDKLNAEISAGAADPPLKARLIALGVEPMVRTPAEFGKFVADEIDKWTKVIQFAGIQTL
jgi:tripartite-type tricarboxylate transporter receptor subunit TctC